MSGPASRVAVCIGRWNPMRSADASARSSSGAFAASTHVTVAPGRAQPRRGGRHAEGLAAHFVGADEKTAHLSQTLYSSEQHGRQPATRRPSPAQHDRAFFGHPRGLSTLFFTEMWERFSYYGMRALLILFMTAPLAAGGLGFDTAAAGAIYGLYTSMVYMATLPGGWIADRLIGQRRAVLYGGILISCGHFSMAFPSLATFYIGLALIVVGTGLLKGNVSVIVGRLYGPQDNRRDAGFSIFYMGINLGAFIAPLICGYLGQQMNWHLGFAAAGVGMVIGIVQYVLGGRYLGDAGMHPAPAASPEAAARLKTRVQLFGALILVALVVAAAGMYTGALPVTPRQIADGAGYPAPDLTVVFFGWLFTSSSMDAGRTPPVVFHRRLLPGGGALLVAVRAGRIDIEPVRGSRHEPGDSRLALPEQLVPVDQFDVRLGIRAGLRLAVASLGPARAVDADQIFARPDPGRRRLRHSRRRGAARAKRRTGQPDVADRHVSAAHVRRTVPESGRPERDDQARPRAHRGPDDGRLVPRRVGRQLHRGTARRFLRIDAAADPVPERRVSSASSPGCSCCRWRRPSRE